MPRARRPGLSGIAVAFLGLGTYLVWAGIRDVAPLDGLRSVLRGEVPPSRSPGTPYGGPSAEEAGADEDDSAAAPASSRGGRRGGCGGPLGLCGFAALAYPVLKGRFGNLEMGGYRDKGSVANSDHPFGKAIDIMTTDNNTAQSIIRTARATVGLKYWIWDNQIASSPSWNPRPYDGPSPHTDHVHLSYI